jgi:hypothetical protein
MIYLQVPFVSLHDATTDTRTPSAVTAYKVTKAHFFLYNFALDNDLYDEYVLRISEMVIYECRIMIFVVSSVLMSEWVSETYFEFNYVSEKRVYRVTVTGIEIIDSG